MHFTIENFQVLAELIYKTTGLKFEENKHYFIKRRIENLAAEYGFKSFDELFRYIRFYDTKKEVFDKLISGVTTHETYFFREFEQLQAFAEICLPEITELKKQKKDNKINIWSAACSTGEEAYTLAIIMLEMLDDPKDWEFKIYATDIDENVINIAKQGIYSERSVKFIPPDYQQKYIYRKLNGFSVIPELKKYIIFDILNLMDDEQMLKLPIFDFIFCRNALIYFDDDSRKQVVLNFYQLLASKGYLFLGHSESVSRICNLFKIKRKDGHILYYKD